jgi:hypothetical protein
VLTVLGEHAIERAVERNDSPRLATAHLDPRRQSDEMHRRGPALGWRRPGRVCAAGVVGVEGAEGEMEAAPRLSAAAGSDPVAALEEQV